MSNQPNPDRGDTTIALAGDWHGNYPWAERALRHLADLGVRTVYHLGDFGIWPHQNRDWFLERVNNLCQLLDIYIWVTPGNHENWSWLDAIHGIDNGRSPRQILTGKTGTQRLFAFPRGHRWMHGGRSFVSLGGAPSVDYERRVAGQDWFVDEMIPEGTAEDVATAGHAEIMLAHDVPNLDIPVLRRILTSNPGGWPELALAYAAIGRDRLDTAYAGVRPRLYAHGHYHVQGDVLIDGTRVLSLSKDDAGGNLVLLDLAADDLGVNWLAFGPGQGPLSIRESIDRYRDRGWQKFTTEINAED